MEFDVNLLLVMFFIKSTPFEYIGIKVYQHYCNYTNVRRYVDTHKIFYITFINVILLI